MYFVVDTRTPHSRDTEHRVWEALWRLRDVVPVVATLPAVVAPACALLDDEPADGIALPGLLPAPAQSAWVGRSIDLAAFADARGALRFAALERALRESVEQCDDAHDTAAWQDAALSADSRKNRRLAILVRGWGSLVRRRGEDPGVLTTLRSCEALLDRVRVVLTQRSRELAVERGYCPSLDAGANRVVEFGAEMEARWRRALEDCATRHRNLLAMSPWDVFPGGERADFRYTDLLPLLRLADTVCFRRDVDIGHWNFNEFKGFHERLGAILRRRNDAGPIAKPV